MEFINDETLENVTGGTIIPYLVKQDDTISKLAKKFRCTEQDICDWNHIENPNMISVGQKLIIMF